MAACSAIGQLAVNLVLLLLPELSDAVALRISSAGLILSASLLGHQLR